MTGKRRKLVGELCIELTRRCNMQCPHCLRGCAQNIDINTSIIRKALSSFSSITSLVLTGGEPSLVPDLIKYTVDYVISHKIDLGGIYVVINGKVFSQKLVNSMRKAYNYAYEKEMCGLCVSEDPFHSEIAYENYMRYSDEIFYRTDKVSPDLDRYLINEGMAYENGIGVRNLIPHTEISSEYIEIDGDEIRIVDDLIYVSAIGNVLLDCDLSYENQDFYAIGNLDQSDLIDIVMAHIAN